MSFDIHTVLSNCSCVPNLEPRSPDIHIVYEMDVRHPHFLDRIQGIKKPIYWTTPAVMALIEKGIQIPKQP
jgi:hypothetical protein